MKSVSFRDHRRYFLREELTEILVSKAFVAGLLPRKSVFQQTNEDSANEINLDQALPNPLSWGHALLL